MIKDDKWYIKCKGYNNSFNSWINEKDLFGGILMSKLIFEIMQQKLILKI